MTTDTITTRGVAATLKRAGFERSNNGAKGVMWYEATTGFVVWQTYHRDSPQDKYVAVKHVIKGSHLAADDEREAIVRSTATALDGYAGALRAAGLEVQIRHHRQDAPWLVVTGSSAISPTEPSATPAGSVPVIAPVPTVTPTASVPVTVAPSLPVTPAPTVGAGSGMPSTQAPTAATTGEPTP